MHRILYLAFIFTLSSAIFLSSCKKDPLLIDNHLDTTITGNEPPPFYGISELQIKLYINKLYVDLIGRQPTTVELDDNFTYLKSNSLSANSRGVIADQSLSPLNTSVSIKENIPLVLNNTILQNNSSTSESAVFEIQIRDRANHYSNILTTPPITVLP